MTLPTTGKSKNSFTATAIGQTVTGTGDNDRLTSVGNYATGGDTLIGAPATTPTT